MSPVRVTTAMSLLFFFRRERKKQPPAPTEGQSIVSHPLVAQAIVDNRADRALDEQVWVLQGIEGTDTDEVRL